MKQNKPSKILRYKKLRNLLRDKNGKLLRDFHMRSTSGSSFEYQNSKNNTYC